MKNEMYDLTFPQRNIWLIDRIDNNTSINMITGILRIEKNFNIDFCKKAINEVIKNNFAMRINIKFENGNVYQVVNDYEYEKIEVVDMTMLSSEEIEGYIQELANTKIDIFSKKLFDFKILKYSDTFGSIFLRIHHIISDAWSFSKIVEQLTKNYDSLENGTFESVEYPSYLDFIASQEEYSKSSKYIKDEEYFKEYLDKIDGITVLKEKNTNISNHSKRYNVKLEKELNDKILDFCKENKISPYVLFLTILSIYIYRIKENSDVIIGTPVLNRKDFKEKQMIGLFITTLPIRIKINGNEKVLDLVRSVSSNTMSSFRHQKFPYENILRDVREKNNIKSNLYSIVLSYQNAKAKYDTQGKYSTKWYGNSHQNEDLQIHILDMDSTGILEINYDYLDELFSEKEISYLHKRLIEMIENLIKSIDITVDDINIITIDEKEKIINEFNNTKKSYNKNLSVIDLFELQAQKNPDSIALIFENNKITYKELNERANIIANHLLKNGVKPKDVISVIMKRSDKLIITLLAILKCRATYLSIDLNYPKNRIEYILENSKSNFVIKDEDMDSYICNAKIIHLNFEKIINNANMRFKNNLNLPFRSSWMNYLIYTSGSTGNPKGVSISIKNLTNFVLGINEEINISREDCIVSITTISFDIFGLELFVPLSFGAKVVVANDVECMDGAKLNKLCLKHNVDIIQTTPTKLKMLLNTNEYIYNMKKILLGGEKVPKDFVDRLKNITKANIYDVYGPTETTVWSSIQNITNCIKITCGKPISNTRIYILDSKNKILPLGVSGQVAIAGDGVFLGYYNKRKETYKSMYYSKELNEKLYLTGDLGMINFDMTLTILDRIDLQVKLNGQRIELEDIEENIKKYEGIKEAAVVLKDKRKLICYYIKENDNIEIDDKDIINFLYNRLPSYMVPLVYKELDKFPLTLNLKTDRKALEKIDVEMDDSKMLYEKPKTPLQEIIYSVFSKVLKRDDFGIDDKFFEMGADSLVAIKAQIELLSYGIHIEYKNLLKYQSIKELEGYIKRNKKEDKESIIEKYEDFSSILLKNKINIEKNNIKKSKVKNILLTGVTGFLGIHILDSFMKQEKGRIYCIIREKGKKRSSDRFYELLHYYFGDKYDLQIGKRIIIVDGDFTKENLGMDLETLNKLTHDIDLVIHSAACVKHYGNADYFKKVNIDGTKNIAKFCYENKKKLMHISTISVSGNSFEVMNSNNNLKNKIYFDETCFYKGQNLDNIYVYTKFKAEEVVLEYVRKGLYANILRIGNLTGRYEDFKFQHNANENAFVNKIKTFIDIGYFPKSSENVYLEFTPVDLCADAIIKIMEHFNMSHNVFHLYDNNHVYIEEFIKMIDKLNLKIDIVEDEEFVKTIDEIAHSDNNQILNGIINDLNEKNMLNYTSNVIVKSNYTRNYLKKIGFYWKKIDEKYVTCYIDYLRKIGIIDK